MKICIFEKFVVPLQCLFEGQKYNNFLTFANLLERKFRIRLKFPQYENKTPLFGNRSHLYVHTCARYNIYRRVW